jgi:hypothetical protein
MTQNSVESIAYGYQATILTDQSQPVGTCFQIAPGILVTAYHVVTVATSGEGSQVYFRPLSGGAVGTADFVRGDERLDLAVLHTGTPLPQSASHLAYSDIQAPDTSFNLIGYGRLPESDGEKDLDRAITTGKWEGTYEYDGIERVRARADGVVQGLSGCPVVRQDDGAVIGVLSSRYNTADGWSSHRIWINRIEDLEPLIGDLADVPIQRRDISSTHRGTAKAQEVVLNRQAIKNDRFFVNPPTWARAWSRGQAALTRGDILVISAPPGVGSTTFAEQLLAHATQDETQLRRLDPGDWKSPTIEMLAMRPRRGYILDLREPEQDDPSSQFVADLNELAGSLKDIRTSLIITVNESLWRGKDIGRLQHLTTVRLNTAPDAQDLVSQHFIDRPELHEIVGAAEVVRHLKGLNAVQAAMAIDVISRQVEYVLDSKEPEDQDLKARIVNALDNHLSDLDGLFGDSTETTIHQRSGIRAADSPVSLSLEDRCLLIAIACHKRLRLAELEIISQQLLNLLIEGSSSNRTTQAKPNEALAAAGLRGRLHRIKAEIGQSEFVALVKPSFGDATVRYVWDNYPPVRATLAAWLVGLILRDEGYKDAASFWLSHSIRRHQDVDFIKNDLRSIAQRLGEPGALVPILSEAVLDPHLQRRCERLLYNWARSQEMQDVVVEVCRHLLESDRRGIALKRLQRVADSGNATSGTRQRIIEVLRASWSQPDLHDEISETVEKWLEGDPDKGSTKLAFLAALSMDEGEVPWLLANHVESDNLDRMLSEAFGDVEHHDAIISMAKRVADAPLLYNQLVERMARAAEKHGALFALMTFANKVGAEPTSLRLIKEITSRLTIEGNASINPSESSTI